MRASLTITGIEVELVVPAGPLEHIALGHYAGFLGVPTEAVCTLEIEPGGDLEAGRPPMAALVERAGAHRFEVTHPSFTGSFELQGRGVIRSAVGAGAMGDALRTLFALLAPFHEGILLRAMGLIEAGQAHVFAGPGAAAAGESPGAGLPFPGGYVMVRRVADAWVAGSTPFQSGAHEVGLPREARLARLCVGDAQLSVDSELSARILENEVVLPNSDEEVRQAVHELTSALAASMCRTSFPFDPLPGSDQRLVPVREPAEVTNRWQ